MFLGKKINFVAKLPNGKRCAELMDEDELAPIEEYPESSLKGVEENSLVELEMPQSVNLDGSLIDLLDDMSF